MSVCVLIDNRIPAAALNCWIGNLQTYAIFHWSPLIYFVRMVYMCACNSFILRAWIFQSICFGGIRGGGEASIENHQYLCIVFLHMHLLFRLMPMFSVGAHLVSWRWLADRPVMNRWGAGQGQSRGWLPNGLHGRRDTCSPWRICQ